MERNVGAIIPVIMRAHVAPAREIGALQLCQQRLREDRIARPIVGQARDQIGRLVGDAMTAMPLMTGDVPVERADPVRRVHDEEIWLGGTQSRAERMRALDYAF